MYNNGNSSKNVTGASIVDGTVETVDIADDAVTVDKLANAINTDIATGVSGSTTAGDALPKAGGAMTGAITTNSTFDGRDVATDGAALDVLDLAINSAADSVAITIDSSENVGIGVTPKADAQSDTVVLQIGSSGVLAARKTAEDVYVSSNSYYDEAWASKRITANQASAIDQTNGKITFRVAPSDTAGSTITFTTGFEVLNDGKARAKNGLLFGTDTAAANALDDYEEGTWTPTVRFSGNSVGVAGTLEGTYVKIGRAVTLSCSITLTSKGSSTGGVTIGGLPFTSESSNGNQAPAAIGRIINISFADMMHAHNNAASDIIYLQETSNAGTLSNIDNTNFTDTSSLKLNVTYQT